MADTLIRTKLHLPFTRLELVSRPRLQVRIAEGLRGPLVLITAPAGFGKTTLVASYIVNCGLPIAWLSLDKDDNQVERFLSYLVAALQETDNTIGSGAAQLLTAAREASPEAVLTSLINDLDAVTGEMVLVLDDYQFIINQAVHEQVAFLLEHCPNTFHLVIASRSDPPLPLIRLRGRGQMVELRAGDLRFTELEAAQFLNDVMGLRLNAGLVALLEERMEGWITGLQMAALSMQHREDVPGFIKGFSGTNRYILDYLLEEVMASQTPEIQQFLLCTSILERLTAPLCEAVLEAGKLDGWTIDKLSTNFQPVNLLNCQPILEYLERANLFLVPLDDERIWYRYHHLFADLLHARLQQTFKIQEIAALHTRAAEWYKHNGLTYEAIHHASMASDDEMVEQLIEKNYLEMMNRGEMSWVRFWMGKLSKEVFTRRPWLCLYEAMNRSWFGQLEEANLLLDHAEKRIRSDISAPSAQSMLGYHAYVKSRVTAMQGDTRRAIELCHTARENIPGNNLGLQIDVNITLGYEYFLYGDFINANRILHDMIRVGYNARAINNPVAGYAILARLQVYQGRLHEAYDLLQKAVQLIHEAGGQYLGVSGLVEVGIAALLCEWNDLEAALLRLQGCLDYLPLWGKADDLCLAYTTLARIQLAQGNRADAADAIEKAAQLIQTCGVFSEARSAVETAQVKMWLVNGDWLAVDRWAATLEKRIGSHDPFQFEDELPQLTQARVFIAQNKPDEAICLLSCLEETARSDGRQGRLIEIMILKALAMQSMGDIALAKKDLTESLKLAQPEGYLRIFLDEGPPMQKLLAQWLAYADDGPVRDYSILLLSQFDAGPHQIIATQERVSPTGDLVEPLTLRELDVLRLMVAGFSNRQIAEKLVIAEGTVKFYVHAVLEKLQVHSRTQAIALAKERNLI
jgi:LuxR family transcriptional regulator, maltose regulon positive regulatory protein